MASPSSKLYHFSLFVHPRAFRFLSAFLTLNEFLPLPLLRRLLPCTANHRSIVSLFAHPLHSSPISCLFLASRHSALRSFFSIPIFFSFFNFFLFTFAPPRRAQSLSFYFCALPARSFPPTFCSFVFSVSLSSSRLFALLTGCFPSARSSSNLILHRPTLHFAVMPQNGYRPFQTSYTLS